MGWSLGRSIGGLKTRAAEAKDKGSYGYGHNVIEQSWHAGQIEVLQFPHVCADYSDSATGHDLRHGCGSDPGLSLMTREVHRGCVHGCHDNYIAIAMVLRRVGSV